MADAAAFEKTIEALAKSGAKEGSKTASKEAGKAADKEVSHEVGEATKGSPSVGSRTPNTRTGLREKYGDGDNRSWITKGRDAWDAHTNKAYDTWKKRHDVSMKRREMWNDKLRIPKAIAKSKIGKLALAGMGIYMFMNGGLSLPLNVLKNMAGGLVGAVTGSWLVNGSHDLAKASEQGVNKTQAHADAFNNTRGQLEHAQSQAIMNTKDDQNGPSDNVTKQPNYNPAITKDDGYEME